MGVQMASAYVGSTLTPPVVGGIVGKFGMQLFPIILLIVAAAMLCMTEWLWKARDARVKTEG